jgi:FMN reductase
VSSIVAVVGSPSTGSRTVAVVEQVARWLRPAGHEVRVVAVRALPPEALLGADARDPLVADAVAAVVAADGVIVGSPVYKASFSGVLKTFLDLLPPGVLGGKAVLPLLTGGAPVHALAVDYALRPVLLALGARHIATGLFLLDEHIECTPEGVVLAPAVQPAVDTAVDEFAAALPAPVRTR